MIQFDEHIFQMGWNHQLVMAGESDPWLTWPPLRNAERFNKAIGKGKSQSQTSPTSLT